MKNNTMLHKQIRVAKFNKNLAKNLAAHDLLLDDVNKRKQHRISEKAHLNIYKFKCQKIETEEERQEALSYINSLFENDNEQFDSRTFSQQKHKLKKWIDGAKTHVEEAELYKKILVATDERQNVRINLDVALEQLDMIGLKISRYNDKKKALTSIINLHNQRSTLDVDHSSPLNAATVSVLFKIPGHNQHDVTPEEQEKLITQYYQDNFPDYEIILSVIHNDEAVPHTHLTLNAKNSRTNEYDFVQMQYEYIKEKADLSDFPQKYSKLTTAQLNRVGELLQDDFYHYTNHFLSKLGKSATFAKKQYDSDEHKAIERQKIKLDTSKRIADREYNTANYYAEKKKLNITEVQKLQDQKIKLIEDNFYLQETHEKLTNKVRNAIKDAIDFATLYALEAVKKPLTAFTEAIKRIHDVSEPLADKTVDEAKSLQASEERRNDIHDAYEKVKRHKIKK